MPGRIKQLVDELIALRTKNSPGVSHFLRAHLLMKGIDPDADDDWTPDDPEKVRILEQMIQSYRRQT